MAERKRTPAAAALSLFLSLSLWALLLLSLGACGFEAEPERPRASERAPTEVYRVVDGQELEVHLFPPRGAHGEDGPGVLLFHGGGWGAGMPEWVYSAAHRFAGEGATALAVEYRLSRGESTPAEALDDVCEAFRWVRRQAARLGVDPSRLAGYGESAGGHLVASVATVGCPPGTPRAEPDLLLLHSPALAFGRPELFADLLQEGASSSELSPIEQMPAPGSAAAERLPPACIVHGEDDRVTPISGARKFCGALRQRGRECRLYEVPGRGHMLRQNVGTAEEPFSARDEAATEAAMDRLANCLGDPELWGPREAHS